MANGEMGGVEPSGEAGGVLAALLGDEGYPAGRLIMMLRVTFIGASSPPAGVVGGITVAASGATSERDKKATSSQIH
jgi:hypothetical protein